MKTLVTTLVGIATLGAALSAFAAPDWQAIEQARKHAQVQPVKAEAVTPMEKCSQKRLVLPLDHGPRAQTTPYLNAKRKEAFDAEMKACKEAAAKSGMTQINSVTHV